MNIENKRNASIYFLLILSLILIIFVIPNYLSNYIKIINLLIWCTIFFVSMKIPNEHTRFKAKNEKIQTIVILLIIYYLMYFLSGLILGYKKSPYSLSFISIIKNMFFILGLGLLQEYVRARLVNSTKNYTFIIIITLVFIVFNIDFKNISSNFQTMGTGFEYVISVIVPLIAKNALLTYLALIGGYQLVYAYKIPVTLVTILLPFFPNMEWFMLTAVELILTYTIFVFVSYEHKMRIKRYTREQLKRDNPIKSVPMLIIILVTTLFVAGFFSYKPIAIMSNSMKPDIARGDVVIVKTLSDREKEQLQVGTIIEYKLEKNVIVHRIVKIGNDINGDIVFTTKGDNNDTQDAKEVTKEQILGEVRFMAKYIGYPSVWFSEQILSKESNIQT